MRGRFLSVVSLLLMTSVVLAQSPKSSHAFAIFKATGLERATGTVTVRGEVKIDGASAVSGQTLFSGNNVETGAASTSTLSLMNSARLQLGAETSLRLEFSRTSLSGSIEEGHIDGLTPAGVTANISTVDASIVTDASKPAAFSIQVESCATTVVVRSGRVELRTLNGPRSLTAGESYSTASPLPSPQQNLTKKKKIGLVVGIGAAVTVLLLAITGKEKQVSEQFGGCVIIPSGESPPCP